MMYCKNLSKALNGNFRCKLKKHVITLDDCKNCSNFILVKNKPIKKVSNKQRKLESYRDSKIIKKGRCEYCHKVFDKLDPHEVYGGCNRKRSIENGFVALLCRQCHSNEHIISELKKTYQKQFEENHSREEFIQIIGKNYL